MKIFTFIFLALVANLSSDLIEVKNFEDILEYIQEDSIVLFDIDDTILIPEQMLGCDEWFLHIFQKYQEEGLPFEEAKNRAVHEWRVVRHMTGMELVEETAPEVIKKIQEKNIPVIGFTTQGYYLSDITNKSLNDKGVDFSLTAPHEEDFYFTLMQKEKKHPLLFQNGILFTGGTHKGDSFFEFCNRINYEPKHVIFLNDKASHLQEIEVHAINREVPFTGLRYGYSDAIKARFSPEIAQKQFEHIPYLRILSDSEAQMLIDK